jgi:N-acetylmuramoyl-L-alanine amidase
LSRPVQAVAAALLLAAASVALLRAQPGPQRGAITVISKELRQSIPVREVDGQDLVSLDDLAVLFQLQVREDQLAGGVTVSRRGRTLVLSSQGLVSSGGRLVSLPSPPVKSGKQWLVPVDFVGRALPLVLDTRAEFRRASRTLLVGEVSVPRVTARAEPGANPRITVDISPRTDHNVVQEPGRLTLRFAADGLDAEVTPVTPGEVLSGIRVSESPPAIVIGLGPRFASFRASDVPVDASSTRVVIDLLPAGGASSTTAAGATPTAPLPGQPGAAPPDAPPVSLFEGPVSGVRTIVIDPGHGGDEIGAKGAAGTLEKDVTLAVARQLRATIEQRLGLRVLLTRDGDETVPLDERAALANNNKADLFVSLHANASVSPAPSGAEVFYLSLDEYGERVRREAEPEAATLPTFGGGTRQVELILWEMAQGRHLQDSAVLASMVEEQLRSRVPMSARAIQQAPFRVLVGANMPAVLVELGFLTNADEEGKLASGPHQSQLVQALFESIARFRAYVEGGRRAAVPATPAPPATAPASPVAPAAPGAPPKATTSPRGGGSR